MQFEKGLVAECSEWLEGENYVSPGRERRRAAPTCS